MYNSRQQHGGCQHQNLAAELEGFGYISEFRWYSTPPKNCRQVHVYTYPFLYLYRYQYRHHNATRENA